MPSSYALRHILRLKKLLKSVEPKMASHPNFSLYKRDPWLGNLNVQFSVQLNQISKTNTFDVTSAISISVLERSWIDLIDDCVFPPFHLILAKARTDPNDQKQEQKLHSQVANSLRLVMFCNTRWELIISVLMFVFEIVGSK